MLFILVALLFTYDADPVLDERNTNKGLETGEIEREMKVILSSRMAWTSRLAEGAL
jgi:hypothetical protein